MLPVFPDLGRRRWVGEAAVGVNMRYWHLPPRLCRSGWRSCQQVRRQQVAGRPSLPAEESYGDSSTDHEDADENARLE